MAQAQTRESGSLEERSRNLDALFQHSLTPLVILDPDFNFIRVNEAYAKACGRNVEDFPGHNHFEFYPSDAQKLFEEVKRTKQPMRVEARAFEFADHPEWGVSYWDWSLNPLLDDSGEVELFVYALQDVTGRVRAGSKSVRARAAGWLQEQMLGRRGALWVTLGASVAEVVLFFGIGRFDSPSHYLGIPGAAAALIAVAAAVTAGPLSGAVVALVGGVAYIAFLTGFGSTVYWPAIVISIVLWTAAAWLAGIAGDYIRRRGAAREAVLSQTIRDRDTLVARLETSEQQYRDLAAENERLYEQQLDIADGLQRTLISVPSEVGAVKVGHLYRSATQAARVGGDFYDVFQVRPGSVVLLIGDVSGHGIMAARTATLVRDVVHAFAHLTLRPAEVLAQTNQLLIENDLPGFVTAFLGVLEEDTGLLRYASAGHPEVLLLRGSGTLERLRAPSVPLGIFDGGEWTPAQVELEYDDRLLLYTDGLIEARQDGDLYGDERLEGALRRQAEVPVEQLPTRVLDEVLAFSGGELKDDVALLAVSLTQRTGGDRSEAEAAGLVSTFG
jgi:PAS domain S-box-containing protein